MTLSKGTLKIYDVALSHLAKIVGDIRLEDLTALHWERYKRFRSDKVKPVTVNIELRSLRAAMNRTVDWKILLVTPFARQRLCLVPESTPNFFSVEDFEKLIGNMKELWFQRLTIFAALTGFRRSEIVNLQWSDIDFINKTIRIQSKADYQTKSGKIRDNAAGETVIEILTLIRPAILMNSDYVFVLNGKKIRPTYLTKKLKKTVKKSKIENQQLHFHSLRHTFASWLAKKGTSIYEIQKLLGHTDLKTTQIYAHLHPNELHKTVNQLEGMVTIR